MGLKLPDHQFDQLVNGMQELSRKTKLKDIYAENFIAVWKRFMNGDTCFAKDINPWKFDEMRTEDNNSDIVRAIAKQIEELNKSNQALKAEISAMYKASKEMMKSGGVAPIGVDRRPEFPSVKLPAVPLLPSGDGGPHSPPGHGHDVDVEQKPPGCGNPNARKKHKDNGDEGDDGR